MLAIGLATPSVEARAACIVDARLALDRHGLRAVAALCRLAEVWLPAAVHGVLRDPRAHARDVPRLVPEPYGAALRALDPADEEAAVRDALDRWSRAAADADLAALPLYHLGDRADECRASPQTDRAARDRCEQLVQGLDVLVQRSGYDLPRGQIVGDCFRDALALCAALAPYGAFILTRLERDGEGAPALCDYADAWRLRVNHVARGASPAAALVRRLLARAGLLTLAWAGVRLACVHVLAPGLPVVGGPDPRLDDGEVAQAWGAADVFWHEV